MTEPTIQSRCSRCRLGADDLWVCQAKGKIIVLCPGCYADRRAQGQDIRILRSQT